MCPVWALGEGYSTYAKKGGMLGLPLLLHGEPGIGKSDQVRQACKDLELPLRIFPVESCDQEDFNGIVVRNQEGRLERLSDDDEMQALLEAGEGVVMLDEMNSNRAMAPALNRLIHERLWCRKPLPPGVRVLAAQNPPHLSAGGRILPASQANRLCHFHVGPHSTADWAGYITSTEPLRFLDDREDLREKLERGFDESRRTLSSLLQGYLHTGAPLQRVPEAGSPSLQEGYPTERSWHMLLNAMSTAKALGYGGDVIMALAEGCIGPGAATEWMAYVSKANLPSLQDVLEGRWTPTSSTPVDISYAVCSNVRQYLSSRNWKEQPEGDKERMLLHTLSLVEALQAGSAKDVANPLVKALAAHFPPSKYSGPKADMGTFRRVVAVASRYDVRLYEGALWGSWRMADATS